MKKNLLSLSFLLFTISSFSQTTPDYVTVDSDKYTSQQLVADVLINSPSVNISNFTSTASCGIGYFNRNNSDFPFKEGMVLSCGQAKNIEGRFNGMAMSSSCSGVDDNDLSKILTGATGYSSTFRDATEVKFNFVATGNKVSFRYLFASNEYGMNQCNMRDGTAFLLKDIATSMSRNLAVVPDSNKPNTPISVATIRQQQYNSACPDVNPQSFAQYNEAPLGDPAQSDINMKGQTVVMTASADVIAGHEYSIKLVIGDSNDGSVLDSAVFIEAGSFDVGQSALGTNEVAISNLSYNPNPVKDVLNINSGEMIESVSVINMLSQELFRSNYNLSNLQVDMSSLSAGAYFVKVQAGQKQSVVKVIKE